MEFDNWSVRATTTLNGAINNSVTSITVVDETNFPFEVPFRILIDNELMKVTQIQPFTDGKGWTIVRARENTAAASHSNGANIYGVLTGESLDNRLSNIIQRGPISLFNASSGFVTRVTGKGRVYLPTDRPVAYFDNGTNFDGFENPPIISSLDYQNHWINQGSSDYTNNLNNGSLGVFTAINSGSLSDNVRATWLSNVGGGRLTSRLVPYLQTSSTDYYEYGVLLLDDTSGKFITNSVRLNVGVATVRGDKWTNATTLASNYFSMPIFGEQVKYIAIQDDGSTNISFYIGPNPAQMVQIYSVSRTDFTSALNRIGIFVNPRPASSTIIMYDYYSVRS